ncbi:unnamed protein product [Peronospora belbahrii]|uniref:Protein ZIP4 homolog n=1 Tax=Peronospora belbahrii TaxID=622444 RepID=A0AAU9KL61_9STRA|nr:unnamed protein product [Peronospora belbahrii]CAH0518910.1 unnamed protein product [Peronospora belbahrii]
MELTSTLLELVSDAAGTCSSSLSEKDLINRLENARKQLQRPESSVLPSESIAIGVCHVTSQVVGFLVQYRPVSAYAASHRWHKRIIMLETAVASAFAVIQSSEDADLALKYPDNREFCHIYMRLLHRLWKASRSPQQAVDVVSVMIKCCILLVTCWLSYDRVGKLVKAEKLLTFCSEFCLEHESLQDQSKWPQFLLGMVNMVENKDYSEALRCFRNVVDRCDGLADEDGVFCYWQAVALIHNNRAREAVIALNTCIRANYEPVACLSLQALASLQALDFYAGAKQLQRALEIDYMHSRSLFNYALLMERVGNFEAQQQLLEYVLGPRRDVGGQVEDSKRKQTTDNIDPSSATPTLFEDVRLVSLFPARLTSVDVSMAHYHLALAAMENGCWLESKKHFEEFLGGMELDKCSCSIVEAARDYVYVLLQCKLPSLALKKCEQYLLELEGSNTNYADIVPVVTLLLHLYKADALLCLERVVECFEYLDQIVQPKIQGLMQQQIAAAPTIDSIAGEIASCHLQLLNNLAVVITCCSGVDAGLSVLRNGLEQYPDCLAIKFNLVLLLWRKGDKTTACSIWLKARGWNLQAKSDKMHEEIPLNLLTTSPGCQIQAPSISEHVQGKLDGEDGVSAQQLLYLDALISNHWHKTRRLQLAGSLQSVEHLEHLGTTSSSRSKEWYK